MLAGALSGCTAVTISNPFDHAKVRLQLQGELMKKGNYEVFFKNSFDCIYKIAKYEGLRVVQKGLFAAYGYHILMNGSRLGTYETVKNLIQRHTSFKQNTSSLNLVIGLITGFFAGTISIPFQIIKVRLQSDHPHQQGARHNYKGVIDAFRKILAKEGIKGLTHGVTIWPFALALASGVQLTTYDFYKHELIDNFGFSNTYTTHMICAATAGFTVPLVCNPMDTVATRLLNQKWEKGHGATYNGIIDCLVKTARSEGFTGLYKGTTGYLSRQVPHGLVTLVAFEFYKRKVRQVFSPKMEI